MARFYGPVGYSIEKEIKPGRWINEITEHNHYGNTIRNGSRWISGDSVNDNLTVDCQISILADEFAYTNFQSIKYVEYMGVRWSVKHVEPKRPRLILTLGGEYHGQ